MSNSQLDYEIKLGSFDPGERRNALEKLNDLLKSGKVAVVPEQPMVNLHSHTFFSFNAYNYSPSAFAWEAKKRGLYAVGIMDHEVLCGVEEFLYSCELLGIRGMGGIETRVFIPEWRDREINMPKEPGVFGFLGCGFISETAADGSYAQKLLQKMVFSARKKIELLVDKLNEHLDVLQINYCDDILTQIPSGGNPTERHILFVLESRAREIFPEMESLISFWAKAMGIGQQEVRKVIGNRADLQLLIRAKLMKQGGPCYVCAEGQSFPTIDESIRMMLELGAVPIAGWLDGLSQGEQNASALLDFMMEKGVPAVSIIPDRNWNVKDAGERRTKISKLHELVSECLKRKMIMVVGTDMSKLGQKFVDDFNVEAIRGFAGEFMKGAMIMTGHSRLHKYIGVGLLSEKTRDRFGKDIDKRNDFFARMGSFRPPGNPHETEKLAEQIKKAWEQLG